MHLRIVVLRSYCISSIALFLYMYYWHYTGWTDIQFDSIRFKEKSRPPMAVWIRSDRAASASGSGRATTHIYTKDRSICDDVMPPPPRPPPLLLGKYSAGFLLPAVMLPDAAAASLFHWRQIHFENKNRRNKIKMWKGVWMFSFWSSHQEDEDENDRTIVYLCCCWRLFS